MALVTKEIDLAAEFLRCGKLVALPTETVYGLGANAMNPQAVAGIFAAKNRPAFDPLIVHIADLEQISRVVSEVPSLAWDLAERFWPGPLTLVLPKQYSIPDLVTSGLATVGVRIPAHSATREILRQADIPVAAPSANPFGRLSPTMAQHVQDHLGDRIDLIFDGGTCRVGLESTILDLSTESPRILRLGGVSQSDLEKLCGPLPVASALDQNSSGLPAPGTLPAHYAPGVPLRLIDEWSQAEHQAESAALVFTGPAPDRFRAVEILSPQGSSVEAASQFFQALHRLEHAGIKTIYAKLFPNEGLGPALNDRLTRAAATFK